MQVSELGYVVHPRVDDDPLDATVNQAFDRDGQVRSVPHHPPCCASQSIRSPKYCSSVTVCYRRTCATSSRVYSFCCFDAIQYRRIIAARVGALWRHSGGFSHARAPSPWIPTTLTRSLVLNTHRFHYSCCLWSGIPDIQSIILHLELMKRSMYSSTGSVDSRTL